MEPSDYAKQEPTPEFLDEYRASIVGWSYEALIDELCRVHGRFMSESLPQNRVRIANAQLPIVKAAIYAAARREQEEVAEAPQSPYERLYEDLLQRVARFVHLFEHYKTNAEDHQQNPHFQTEHYTRFFEGQAYGLSSAAAIVTNEMATHQMRANLYLPKTEKE